MANQATKIREELASGRTELAELAETVQALVEKADVKGRVLDAISDNADQLHEKATSKASQISSIARDLSKSGSNSRRKASRSGSSRYVAAGVGALLLMLFVVRRGHRSAEEPEGSRSPS